MQFSNLVTALFLSAAAVSAAPLAAGEVAATIERRAATCGGVFYSDGAIGAAANRACDNWQNGDSPGGYPHTYNNREGFRFGVGGPYIEFPILSGGIYNGGSPGADRVVINANSCALAGVITHRGASGNNFVGCS